MMKTNDPHALIHEALQSLDISLQYSDASMRETEHWLQNDGLEDPELLDMTHLPFVTIDNEDSRDLDQALYLERTDTGYRVMYALADAAYYIQPGSALFDEALQRGTSYYTPILAVAMLPKALSEGLISLNPNVERRSLIFDMSLDEDAAVTNLKVVRAKIQSDAKLSYTGVQEWLNQATISEPSCTEPFHNSLLLLKEVGIKLIKAGETRGVIRFDRSETRIEIAGCPPKLMPLRRERVETERYNEQISLMCNMQGAELLLGLSGISDVVQAIFRVHEAPLRKSLNNLKQVLDAMADVHTADVDETDKRWRWQNGQSLADYVNALPGEPRHQRRVRAIQRQIMQAQRSSRFTPQAGEHHALKVCSYARFSSPMREVVGIFTHKELLEALGGSTFDNNSADEALREKVILAANSARQRQRQLDKKIELSTLQTLFMSDLNAPVTPWHKGTIMGIRSDKLYISLDDFALDVKIYKDDLDANWQTVYTFGSASATADDTVDAPTWLLGQGIKLRIQSFDSSRQRLVFNLRPLDK